MRRSDEIRLKRNRLVHDTGIENHYLDSDAKDIYNNINSIIEQYLKTTISSMIYKQNNDLTAQENQSENEPTFPMFISTITPHTFEQAEFIEEFCNSLKKIGIKPIRCTMTDFDRYQPMQKVRNYLENCHGIIVLGLERSHTYFYRDKEGSTKDEHEDIHRHYSSAWLQLETGIAFGLKKDIFVLCQENLYGDGIFDRSWNSYPPIELKLPLSINDPKVQETLQVLKEYKEKVEELHNL
ncbi:hypothetical protein P261_00129 [Lachnospiraceae bacterium TWA4]|nr:hypothetical protein P261_00129 [Lachnospiraceae bacterium TWA4]